jgi:hypothetical protein
MFVCVTLGFFAGKIGFGARHKKQTCQLAGLLFIFS